MARFKLVPYSIRIKDISRDRYVALDKIPVNRIHTNSSNSFIDFYGIFVDFCDRYTENNIINREDSQKTLFFERYTSKPSYRIVYGTIKSGDYGYEADFLDIRQRRLIRSARQSHHSELIPFFFLLHLPLVRNRDRGFLILETFRNQGIKSILQDALEGYLKDITGQNNLRLEINPLISQELVQKLESADRILEIKFIKRKIPRNVADKNLLENYEDIYEERSFKIKRNRSLRFIGGITDNLIAKLKNVEYPYYEIQDEKYDQIKIVIESEGSTHTLTINGGPKLRERRILNPEELEFEGGFPTESSLLTIAISYLNYILERNDENLINREEFIRS